MTTWRRSLLTASRLLLGGVFLYAGAIKAANVTAFAGQIANYQILPYAFNYLAAALLPYVEILCGVLLVVHWRMRPALLVLGGLNLVFMAVLTSALLRGLDIDCGCFDPSGTTGTSAGAALLRDLGLMVLIVVTWVLEEAGTRRRSGGARTV